ncbi:MAG: GNAT family protein [Rhodomicrobiaceae bacterium]
MVFLRTVPLSESGPLIRGDRVWLRVPQTGDYADWAQLRGVSDSFLKPWEPEWSYDELTRSAFRRRLRHYQRDMRDGLGYAFFLFRNGDNRLLGGVTLTNARRGVSQSVSIGYWVGEPHARQGYMTAAVGVLVPFVFESLGFHRIEAACLESNAASRRLLEKCGFQHEGLARKYLKINGQWQDHLLYAAIQEDLRS